MNRRVSKSYDNNIRKAKRRGLYILPLSFIAFVVMTFYLSACTSLDCPLNNKVSIKCCMKGEVDTLNDTLTVRALRADGSDTILFNRGTYTTYLTFPPSYSNKEDVLAFDVTDTTGTVSDTIRITKSNHPHFESVDCGPTFFHDIIGIYHTHHAIDSIVINYPHVDNDTTNEHLYIYYHPNR